MYTQRTSRNTVSYYPGHWVANEGLCAVDRFVQGGIVTFRVKTFVTKLINGDLGEPVFTAIVSFYMH